MKISAPAGRDGPYWRASLGDSDDLHAVHRIEPAEQQVADRILAREGLARQRFINDDGERRVIHVAIVEIAAPPSAECRASETDPA